jgi:branched-chain amino acid transport system substrate-binding protein
VRRRLAVLIGLFATLALGLTACGGQGGGGGGGGGGEGGGTQVQGDTLTIYSSLPKQGANEGQTEAVENGIKLALKEAGNKAGRFNIQYRDLDDSTAQAGKWEPGATSANARRAAQDPTTIAYIGEFNSGASAISLPLLNEAGVPQVSPSNTAVGLTTDEPGAEPGEPAKYYPTGKRHYARVVPKDTIQGAALASTMKDEQCTKVAIINDKEVYGAGLARNIENSAKEQGLQVTGNDGIDPQAPNYRALASSIDGVGADCVVYSGITANNAVQLFKDLDAALPDAKLFGPDGIAEAAFADPSEGGVPANVAEKTLVTQATLSPEEYGAEGKKFFEDYQAEYNEDNPDPYAIYGFESAQLVLDAIERAGDRGNDRQAVIDALLSTRGRDSVLGTYDVDQNGDTTLTDYGVFRVTGGELEFDRKVEAAK